MVRRPRTEAVSPVWLVLGSIVSVQVGGAFAKALFGAVPPLAVAWLRLTSAALVLCALARPWRALPRRTDPDARRRWLLVAAFAVSLCSMNIVIYLAFARLPLGLAVTLEFLGPLGVAVAGSRRLFDLLWVALAGTGVALLGLARVRLDALGVCFALLAACAWAGYIVIGARMNGTWRGIDALAIACSAGALALTPVSLATSGPALWHPRTLLTGLAVGLLSTVVPYSLELRALKRLPTAAFGILMSLEPVAAALAALLVLREHLTPVQLLAMACVVVASVCSTRSRRRA